MAPPQLSAILVVGQMRARGQRVLDALCAQTLAAEMQIVVVDLAARDLPRLAGRPPAELTYVEAPDARTFVRARLRGIAAARAGVVAFIEDHCFPEPGWAEAVVAAHREGPWPAVGYGLTNANPERYVSRASMLADYGPWDSPTRSGPTDALPSHNVSYKRAVLVEHWDDLETLLAPDQVLHERLRRAGATLFVAANARAAHENFTRVSMLLQTNFAYGRLYAAQRARAHQLTAVRRLALGALAATVAPWHRFVQLVRALRGRGQWARLAAALPVLAPAYAVGAAGVSLGYLVGPGAAEARLTYFDFEIEKNL